MSITWKTGPNRGQSKQVDKKKIKKYADAWAKANGYKPQASSSKRQASSKKDLDSHKIPDIR